MIVRCDRRNIKSRPLVAPNNVKPRQLVLAPLPTAGNSTKVNPLIRRFLPPSRKATLPRPLSTPGTRLSHRSRRQESEGKENGRSTDRNPLRVATNGGPVRRPGRNKPAAGRVPRTTSALRSVRILLCKAAFSRHLRCVAGGSAALRRAELPLAPLLRNPRHCDLGDLGQFS